MIRVVLFGAPGAGKGTQAETIAENYGFKKISTGDIVRAEVSAGTPVGLKVKSIIDKGELVPDQVMIDLLKQRLSRPDIEKGYIIDGFPRTTYQAEALSNMTVQKEVVIYLKVGSEDTIVKRMLSRLTCSQCGAIYNIQQNPPKVESRCDICNGTIKQRSDDNSETVRKRIAVYREQTKPVINYYREKGVLHEIDASRSVEEVFNSIAGILS